MNTRMLVAVALGLGLASSPRDSRGYYVKGEEEPRRAAYVAFGGNSDGNFGFAVAGRGARFGLELGIVANSEFSDADAIDTSIPHNDFTSLGRKRVGSTYGLDFLFFHDFKPGPSFFLGAGLYASEVDEIVQSNVTGWYWKQSKGEELIPSMQVGLQLFTKQRVVIGAAYHTYRGPTLQLGRSF